MLSFKCLSSGSRGNCYLIEADSGTLILDCGISIKGILSGLNFDIRKVVGAVCTHIHTDHHKAVDDLEYMGINVFKPYESENPKQYKQLGEFKIQSFELPHNGTNNVGYYIKINDQRILYLTDFEYCKYSFVKQQVQHIIVEANYDEKYLDKNIANFEHKVLGHCSLQTCKDFVSVNKSKALRNVVLCHLGAYSSDKQEFIKEIQSTTGVSVNVNCAEKGLEIELSEFPF